LKNKEISTLVPQKEEEEEKRKLDAEVTRLESKKIKIQKIIDTAASQPPPEQVSPSTEFSSTQQTEVPDPVEEKERLEKIKFYVDMGVCNEESLIRVRLHYINNECNRFMEKHREAKAKEARKKARLEAAKSQIK
jgi:hypothetical protein